jgi:hypothetical protein
MVQKMTQCQVISEVCLVWTQDLDYPQNFLLRVVAHLDIPNPSFFLAFLNLEDEIPFKGGSLSHPKFFKILECETKF